MVNKDAVLGAAWRRCEAALPEEWSLNLDVDRFVRLIPPYEASAWAGAATAEIYYRADTPTAALEGLAEILEARGG